MILDYVPKTRNEYQNFVSDQKYAALESFTLESGVELIETTVAYKTWGKLNSDGDNCLVLCHALSGSSDVEDWWGPLIGLGKAFDISRYFIFCANVLGSPYGTSSPLTTNQKTGRIYGPDFPQTTVRDDIRLNKLVLDALGVQSISAVVGGSMGGFAALEWPLCTPKGYVRNIVPISTSVDHDAWGIAWAEAQRQCVFADPVFDEGNYIPTPAGQPATGLAAARMVAMLTYRSSPSFNSRFGRKAAPQKSNKSNGSLTNGTKTNEKKNPNSCANMTANTRRNSKMNGLLTPPEPQQKDDSPTFTAQSYLKYQGGKFINRFDANCFIHLTRKMDCHDVLHGRIEDHDLNAQSRPEILSKVFSNIPPKSLVIGIESDVLFRPEQQAEIASALPDAKLVMIPSAEGHDGFLLEFESLGPLIEGHLRERCAWIYEGGPLVMEESTKIVKDSVFGEVESGW